VQRHGISRLPEVEGDKPDKRKFKTYPIGYFHIDIAKVRSAAGKLYLFVAIDRTSKFAFAELHKKADRSSAARLLEALIAAVPYRLHTRADRQWHPVHRPAPKSRRLDRPLPRAPLRLDLPSQRHRAPPDQAQSSVDSDVINKSFFDEPAVFSSRVWVTASSAKAR
jgi:hypothetical protein